MAEEQEKTTESKALELAQEAVMVKSVPVAEGTPVVKGYDFNTGRDLDGIMAAAMTTGFQVCVRAYVRKLAWYMPCSPSCLDPMLVRWGGNCCVLRSASYVHII